ncbi:MAG: VWA domain-containing protein [Acidimicrobiales bacterium]
MVVATLVRGTPVAAQVDDDRIQVLGAEESDDGQVVLELALPSSIGELAPVTANFGITENSRLVEFAVAPVTMSADVIVVLDTSGSMDGPALAEARAAAAGFIRRLPADARVGVVGFGEEAAVETALGTDHQASLAALDGLAAGGETALWDALVVAADVATEAGSDRPYVVVLSDGDDTVSDVDLATAVERLRQVDGGLYAIAIESPDADMAALDEAVALVGGEFMSTDGTGELASLYVDIAHRLANRYELRYPSLSDGPRSIVVSVDVGGAVATARTELVARGAAPVAPVDPIDAQPTPAEPAPAGPGPAGPAAVEMAIDPGPLAASTLLPVGAAAIFAALLVLGLLIAVPATQVRLAAVADRDRVAGVGDRLGSAANRFVASHDQEGRLDRALDAAGVRLRPGEFLLFSAVVIAVLAMVASVVGGPLVGVAALAAGAVGMRLLLSVRAGRRRNAFADQLTDSIGIMSGGLRVGRGLVQAIELVATESPSPTAEQFRRVVFEIRMGRDPAAALLAAAERMDSPDLAWLTRAVDINRELGGDLTELLEGLAATIRERRRIARHVSALSAEGRASAWVLLAMPVAMFGMLAWRTPDSVALLTGTGVGLAMLGLSVVGMVAGFVWIRKLVDLRY